MFPLATIHPVVGMLLGVGFIATGIYLLSQLGLPVEERRKSCRWGKRGRGPAASVISIVVWSVFIGGAGAVFAYHAFVGGEPGTIFVDFWGACFAALLVCGVCDWILEDRRKKPNQAPEPTAPSGRGSS